MNWNDVIAEIESPDFDAKINVVSGMDGVLQRGCQGTSGNRSISLSSEVW